ncbi:MAG: hypothetical protein EA427_14615 [Spirochaetaceae bacterium]|nr:MAG: hypothetical protein EA427_14615 [Spirochaetaceae bacterium]
MKLQFEHLREGFHFLRRRFSRNGHRRYAGSPKEIIRQTVQDNFDGHIFAAGQGNHRMFYIRDIGLAAPGLLYMGMREELEQCMRTALRIWEDEGRVTTSINHKLKAVDVFEYGADSLSLLLRTLRLLGSNDLVHQYEHFLNKCIRHYGSTVFDPEMSLVRDDRPFSTTKDNTIRPSPLYANLNMLLLQHEIWRLRDVGHRLEDPLKEYDTMGAVMERFWMYDKGSFRDALGHEYVAADQIFAPFLRVFHDEPKISGMLDVIIKEGLADPLPLKYTQAPKPGTENKLLSMMAPNYQGNTIWTMLGVAFLWVLHEREDARTEEYLRRYERIIARDGNCIEIYNPDLSMYRAPAYVYDEGMTWFAPLYRVLDERGR